MYDLDYCIGCTQSDITVPEIERVWAFVEGEHDQNDWCWVLELKDGTFGMLRGGCDYTGWD